MASWNVPLAALLLLTVGLAGCADEEPEPVEEFEDLGLQVTQETGVIRGVVVDAAIRPVEGVAITVQGANGTRDTTTNAQGVFGMDKLAPGAYFVKASKVGFVTTQQNVQVVAGEIDPAPVRLLLEVDPKTALYYQEMKFEGFIECSFSLGLVGFAACDSLPENNDEFIVEYILDKPPTWVQSELVWETTQSVSEELTMLYSADLTDATLLDNWEEVDGVSPLLIQVNETRAQEVGLGKNITLMIRVFNQHKEGTSPDDHSPDPADGDDCYDRPALGGCLRGFGATVSQDFTILTHVFYGYAPPPDWRFTADANVPQPPQ